jgi:hypothetical protein
MDNVTEEKPATATKADGSTQSAAPMNKLAANRLANKERK